MSTAYRNVFITGASSGLGEGLARWFAKEGSRVFAAARRTDRLEALKRELPQDCPGRIDPVELDVTDTNRTRERMQALDLEHDGMDLVIANAGVGEVTDGKKLRWEPLERTLRVNILGAAATLAALLPAMVERNRGHLVGMSSVAAWILPPKTWAYSASKTFVAQMCAGLTEDLRGTEVKVTSIHPGYVKSELTAQNSYHMPFLMETQDAVELMGQGILRGDPLIAFPWQTVALVRASIAMPAWAKRLAFKRATGAR